MTDHAPTEQEKAKAQSEKLAAEQRAANASHTGTHPDQAGAGQSAKAAEESRQRGSGAMEARAKEEQRQAYSMTADEYSTFRAGETKLNPDTTSLDWFGTNGERWEMERRSSILSARSNKAEVPENILKDFVLFDGKPAVIYVDGFPVSIMNASVGAQIKRQESHWPTQAALYEYKITVNGQTFESSRAVTMEELVPVVAGFIHRLPHAAVDASATKTHWSQGKNPAASQAPQQVESRK